jgi:hypothetical protein
VSRVTLFKFAQGDTVRWTSSAHGSSLSKTGVVEEIVPPNERPKCEDLKRPVGLPRKEESYVIRVGKVGAAKGTAYWPLVSKLVKVK